MMEQKNKKTLMIAGAAVAVVLVAVLAFWIIKKIAGENTKLHLLIAPASSKVEIDGKAYESTGDFEIKTGKHTAVISKEGFKTQTIEFTANADETADVETYLIQNDGGEDWYASHPDDDEIRWFIDEIRHQNKTNDFYNSNPILSQLPIAVEYYSNNYTSHVKYEITSEVNSSYTAFTIEISDYTGGNYNNALDKIREAGFNPDDYIVNYHDYSEDSGWGQAF